MEETESSAPGLLKKGRGASCKNTPRPEAVAPARGTTALPGMSTKTTERPNLIPVERGPSGQE